MLKVGVSVFVCLEVLSSVYVVIPVYLQVVEQFM